jgi:hypothetical protein
MGIIATTKYGDCAFCPATNTNVVKVKKELVCLACHRTNKAKVQVQKAYVRNKVRGLIDYEREIGVLDSTKELILDLDRVVSRYLRLREMGADRKCQCFTCSTRKDWTKVHAGHFIPRTNLYFRWDLTYNLHVQCPNCNVTLRGNYKVYAEKLELERKGIVEWMQEQAREVYSPTRDELKMLLFDFQQKLRVVEAKIKYP